MQTIPLCQTTGIIGSKIVRIRTKARSGKTAEIKGLSRQTVREVELAALERKYDRVPLGGVKHIGIDEVCVFHREHGGRQYITVIRDLDTGRILNVSRGKGEDALKIFASRLKRLNTPPRIECVTMDMANGCMNFVENNFPDAAIVFDHFHVIKMINGKINKIRWLVKQAYGYRDYRYFRLKVLVLPNLKSRESDC